VFGEITSGASNDIERATGIARKMVCEWGMSEKIGPLAFGEKEGGEVFLGRDLGHMKNYSEATAVEIDSEIRRIVQENYQRTRQILEEHQEGVMRVAAALLEKETLNGPEIRLLAMGEPAETESAEISPVLTAAGDLPAEA
jgi:cell division protease FtsH